MLPRNAMPDRVFHLLPVEIADARGKGDSFFQEQDLDGLIRRPALGNESAPGVVHPEDDALPSPEAISDSPPGRRVIFSHDGPSFTEGSPSISIDSPFGASVEITVSSSLPSFHSRRETRRPWALPSTSIASSRSIRKESVRKASYAF